MTSSLTQPASDGEGAHLVLYDGVCGLCSRLLQFLFKHDRRAVFTFASLQSAVGRATVERFGGDAGEVTTFYVMPNYRVEHAALLNKSTAVLFIAGELGWPWTIAKLARVIPKAIRDRIYDVVARARYRLFGRLNACSVPQPEFRRRVIDG